MDLLGLRHRVVASTSATWREDQRAAAGQRHQVVLAGAGLEGAPIVLVSA
jgi:hypothetical protein